MRTRLFFCYQEGLTPPVRKQTQGVPDLPGPLLYRRLLQNENRSANCICREKFACEVIFPKVLLPYVTFGP